MSYDLDVVINTLQKELKTRGIDIDNTSSSPKLNNFMNDINENRPLNNKNKNNMLKNQPVDINKRDEIQIKQYIETTLYKMIMPIKDDIKNYLTNINFKIINFERELLKINPMNENIRNFSSKLSKLENDYNLLSKNINSINSLSVQNKSNIESINQIIKININENSNSISKLTKDINKVINNQSNLENKITNNNDNNNKNIIDEKKIIDKINNIYKEKEKSFDILANNLFSKINKNSEETEKTLELLGKFIK